MLSKLCVHSPAFSRPSHSSQRASILFVTDRLLWRASVGTSPRQRAEALSCNKTPADTIKKKRKKKKVHSPASLLQRTITATVNFPPPATSTPLPYRHVVTLFNFSLWLHQEAFLVQVTGGGRKTTRTFMARCFPSQQAQHAYNLPVTPERGASVPETPPPAVIGMLQLLRRRNETPRRLLSHPK